MRIEKISVKNFRSIQEVVELDINGLSIFVGQNNHGKSNFFEAIDWFFSPSGSFEDICFMRKTENIVYVEIVFSGLQSSIDLIKNEKHRMAIRTIFGECDLIKIKRATDFNDGKIRQLFNPNNSRWENTFGTDTAWNQLMPTVEFISTKRYLEDVAKYGKVTPISRLLSGVLDVMLQSDPDYIEFKRKFNELFGQPEDESQRTAIRTQIDSIGGEVAAYLQKQFPECSSVSFQVENPEIADLFKKFKVLVDDGVQNEASEKGDEMQRALMLAIIQTYSDFRRRNGETRKFLFLIDEAELHLHPSAQRALKRALAEIVKGGDQVLINTHSSVLIADSVDSQETYSVFKVDHVSSINKMTDSEKPNAIFDLLGGSPTDLLLPSNIVIVEGYSEMTFLRLVINRFYSERFAHIQIVPANGDITIQEKSMTFVNNAYELFKASNNPYYGRVIVIADKPSSRDPDQEKYTKFHTAHPEVLQQGRYFQIIAESLEEYYPNPYTADPNVIKANPGKNEYARNVGVRITQNEFESRMPVLYQALITAEKLSFKA